jgi:hypothetical protein
VHLTAAEAALIGALLGALVTALATLFAQRAAKRIDHLTRIWEREMDVYESILVDSRSWADLRSDGTRRAEQGSPGTEDLISLPETDIDELKRRRLLVQLEMFGRPDVTAAYEAASAANKRWISAYATHRSMLRLNHDVAAGHRPPPPARPWGASAGPPEPDPSPSCADAASRTPTPPCNSGSGTESACSSGGKDHRLRTLRIEHTRTDNCDAGGRE